MENKDTNSAAQENWQVSNNSVGGSAKTESMARVPFGEALRYYRKRKGFTQVELAAEAGTGMTQAAVALAEKSSTPLRNRVRLNAIARALDISPSVLVMGLVPASAEDGGGDAGAFEGGEAWPQDLEQAYISAEFSPLQASQPPLSQGTFGHEVLPPGYNRNSREDVLAARLDDLENRFRDVERFLVALQQSITTLQQSASTLSHLTGSAQDVVTGSLVEIDRIRTTDLQPGARPPAVLHSQEATGSSRATAGERRRAHAGR